MDTGRNYGRSRKLAKACTAGAFALALLIAASTAKAAGGASSATLTVTMTLQSSLNLVFDNNANVGTTGYCPLGNAGTSNVTLNLGSASFYGGSDTLACVSYSHVGGGNYEVSSGFDVVVTKQNSASPNYSLSAEISTAPPANVTWMVSGTALTTAGYTTLDASDSYSTNVTKYLQVKVKNNVAAGALTETVTFLATAN